MRVLEAIQLFVVCGYFTSISMFIIINACHRCFVTPVVGQAVKLNGVVLPDTVQGIMNRWVLQMGFPVVTIDTTTGDVTQKHFLLSPEAKLTSPYKYAANSPLLQGNNTF